MRDKKEAQGVKFFNNFLKDVKGLSNVIVTLIMIVLVLIAVGLVWTAVQSNIESGTEQIEISAKCLKVDIKATKLECTGGALLSDSCTVTVKRNVGGDDLAGIKLVLTNTLGEINHIEDVPGNIDPLGTKTTSGITAIGVANVTKVEVAPYFIDPSGNEQLCPLRGAFGS